MGKPTRNVPQILQEIKNNCEIANKSDTRQADKESTLKLWREDITEMITLIATNLGRKEDNETKIEKNLESINKEVQIINKKLDKNKVEIENIKKIINAEKINQIEEKIKQLTDDTNQQLKQLEGLKKKLASVSPDFQKQKEEIEEIINGMQKVNIEGNAPKKQNQIPYIKPPTFKGEKYEKPLKFLADLKKYADIYKDQDCVMAIINQSLQDSAKDWFYIIEGAIHNYEEFEERFKAKYWSNDIKKNLMRKIELGTYTPKGKLSRVQYATKLLNIAKDVYEPYNEQDIIKKIAQNFDREIRIAMINLKIETVDDLFNILEAYDIDKESPKKYIKNYKNPHTYSYNDKNNQENQNAKNYIKIDKKQATPQSYKRSEGIRSIGDTRSY